MIPAPSASAAGTKKRRRFNAVPSHRSNRLEGFGWLRARPASRRDPLRRHPPCRDRAAAFADVVRHLRADRADARRSDRSDALGRPAHERRGRRPAESRLRRRPAADRPLSRLGGPGARRRTRLFAAVRGAGLGGAAAAARQFAAADGIELRAGLRARGDAWHDRRPVTPIRGSTLRSICSVSPGYRSRPSGSPWC